MTVNIGSQSFDWRASACSNFSISPFEIDGVQMASVEGFIQGIKWPPDSSNRHLAFRSFGVEAKRRGRGAERKFVWWKGEAIVFGSPEHHALIARAIREKFEQNVDAMEALLMTAGEEITHDLGHPENPKTSLPAEIFCKILMDIRDGELARKV